MIRTSNKTISDYWEVQSSRTKPVVRQNAGNNAFRRIMASAYQADGRSYRSGDRGLTLADYWRRPVASNCYTAANQAPEPGHRDPASARETASVAETGKQMAPAFTPIDDASTVREKIDQTADAAARRYDLPAGLVKSVIRHESNFDPRAVSPAGAQGLMQLMPATARELGVNDPFDIRQNIDGGCRYLRRMLDHFDGDVRKALAAYNAGPGTVRRYGGVPPYPETRRYVRKVMSSAATAA